MGNPDRNKAGTEQGAASAPPPPEVDAASSAPEQAGATEPIVKAVPPASTPAQGKPVLLLLLQDHQHRGEDLPAGSHRALAPDEADALIAAGIAIAAEAH